MGTQGILSRGWTLKGERLRLPRAHGFVSLYFVGAVIPDTGEVFSLVFPVSDSSAMQLFLDAFSKTIEKGKHVVLVLDNAPWHKKKTLKIPVNISIVFLPPYSPELNPIEQLWKELKHRWLSNFAIYSYDALLEACVSAWEKLKLLGSSFIQKLCHRGWAKM